MIIKCDPLYTHGDTMNPTVDVTFEILDKLLGEMAALFPKPFLHLGAFPKP
jgi:N-acetyl-beta-hexosaminidase